MTTIKVLVVTITNHLSVSDHVRDVISKCSQTTALKVLRCRDIKDEALRQVYKAVIIAKLLYASLAWWGIWRQQTKSVSRRLFDEEFDSDCTRLTSRRQRNLPTTTTTISLAAYLPTDRTYSNSCFRQDKLSIGYDEWMNNIIRHSEVRTSREQQSIVTKPTQTSLWN